MERQLITILINNCNDNIEQLGLFEGIMGNCLALYLLNKQIHCIEAERIAENMLERVSNEIYKIQSNTLDKGLSGIGWAINELLKTNCVEGDVDDILYEVDSIIYKFITDPLNQINIGNTANGLIGYLIYTVSRLENPNHMKSTFLHRLDAAMFRNVIDRIDNCMPSFFYSTTKDLYIYILWEFPILYVWLKKAIELNLYTNKIINMINSWIVSIKCFFPYYNTNRLSLAVSLAYLNEQLANSEITEYVDTLINSINFDNVIKEIDPRINNINEGWLLSVFLLYSAEKYICVNHPKYLLIRKTKIEILKRFKPNFEYKLSNYTNSFDLSLIKGISGISIMYVLCPEMLNIE